MELFGYSLCNVEYRVTVIKQNNDPASVKKKEEKTKKSQR
jgi:hypothetical protein